MSASCRRARSGLDAPLAACDEGVRSHLDLWLTYHADLKRSEKHMVMVYWLKHISGHYACSRMSSSNPAT